MRKVIELLKIFKIVSRGTHGEMFPNELLSRTVFHRIILFGPSSMKSRKEVADIIMMYKTLSKRLSMNPTDFCDGILTRLVRGKLKLRCRWLSRASAQTFYFIGL